MSDLALLSLAIIFNIWTPICGSGIKPDFPIFYNIPYRFAGHMCVYLFTNFVRTFWLEKIFPAEVLEDKLKSCTAGIDV